MLPRYKPIWKVPMYPCNEKETSGDEKETSGLWLDLHRRKRNRWWGRGLLARRRWGRLILPILRQKSVCRGWKGFFNGFNFRLQKINFSAEILLWSAFILLKDSFFTFPIISYFSEVNHCVDPKKLKGNLFSFFLQAQFFYTLWRKASSTLIWFIAKRVPPGLIAWRSKIN